MSQFLCLSESSVLAIMPSENEAQNSKINELEELVAYTHPEPINESNLSIFSKVKAIAGIFSKW